MSLTGDEFNEIMESLRSDAQGKSASEKRGAPRVGLRSRGTIVAYRRQRLAGAPIPIWIRDLSVTGIGIMHCHPLDAGAQFVAQFERATKPPISVLYTVINTRPVSKTIFSIGARMEKVLDAHAVQQMTAAATKGRAAAARRPA